jgi:urease accessory protein
VRQSWPIGSIGNSKRGTPHRPDREHLIDACTEIVACRDRRGNTVLRQLRCEVPLVVRQVNFDSPVLQLAMVNAAAGPLGGDRLRLRVVVEPGATVAMRSIAAALAQPGPYGRASTLDIDVTVAPDAVLAWLPQPTVSVAGSDHRVRIALEACAGSTVRLREGAVLGRHGEPPGRLALHERVTVDGAAVLDHETVLAAGAWSGPGAHGNGRYFHTEIVIDDVLPPASVLVTPTCQTATVQLAPRCALVVARAAEATNQTAGILGDPLRVLVPWRDGRLAGTPEG